MLSLFKKKLLQKKILVLMYHRIAVVERDPWELSVSPEHFEEQLQVLQRYYPIVSVPGLIKQLNDNTISDDAVCLTFDDGYTDNFHIAKPLLYKYNAPASFFIPTHALVNRELFWWDELETLLLDTETLPPKFTATIRGEKIEANLDDEAALHPLLIKKQSGWTWPQKPPTKRTALYLSLWEKLKPLEHHQLRIALDEIKQWAQVTGFNKPSLLPMTVPELKALAADPLFHIGVHTVTHPALSAHSYTAQKEELEKNFVELERICETPMNSVAFPYGDYNQTTLDIVKELNISAAFSTKAFPVAAQSDITNLGRFQVKNWNKKAFEKTLKEWFRIK